MEKLQAALEKARKNREEQGHTSVPLGNDAPPSAPQEDARRDTGDWDQMPFIEPSARALIKERVVASKASPDATPFDVLRTKLLLQMRRHNWSRVAITSPTPRCGKTTIAANLAASFGRQEGIRTILFEFDMRRPRLSDMFGFKPDHDITEFLTGKVKFHEQAFRVGDNLALSIAARRTDDPTTHLLSGESESVLAEVEAEHKPDIMIFDLPPILAGDDARAFLKQTDCALLVAFAEETTPNQIDLCEREIAEHTNVAGVVLNKCRFPVEDDGYGYYGY